MSEFEDKVVLITDAGQGIGRAIAEAFAQKGACVAINDLTPINLDETLQRIMEAGGRAKDYIFDVAKKMPVQGLVESVLEDWGRIDVLVNSAAVDPHAGLLSMDEWDWQRTLDVNLSGPFFTMQSVGRVMRGQGGGVMVNIPGRPDGGAEGFAYLSSTGGLLELTRQAARELVDYGIRVNAIRRGTLENGKWGESGNRRWLKEIPQGNLGVAETIAEVTLFLCSDAATHLTGETIVVEAGKAWY